MIIIDTSADLRSQVSSWRQEGCVIAFVPTMGNLHDGHLSLVDAVRQHVAAGSGAEVRIVASIFVNPMQFGPNEDFDTYPRTFNDDVDKLEHVGVDLVFAPSSEEMYPSASAHETRVVPPEIADILEGESRPGFFTGVATVVNKLFNMVTPDVACFGEKDYQQLLVIRKMVEDFAMPIEIIAAPIVREDDGLAMSSRNAYLDEAEREQAARLNVCLRHVVSEAQKGTDLQFVVMHAAQELEQHGLLVDYVVVRRRPDLGVPDPEDSELIVLVAAKVGTTRLIDNMSFAR